MKAKIKTPNDCICEFGPFLGNVPGVSGKMKTSYYKHGLIGGEEPIIVTSGEVLWFSLLFDVFEEDEGTGEI